MNSDVVPTRDHCASPPVALPALWMATAAVTMPPPFASLPLFPPSNRSNRSVGNGGDGIASSSLTGGVGGTASAVSVALAQAGY